MSPIFVLKMNRFPIVWKIAPLVLSVIKKGIHFPSRKSLNRENLIPEFGI